MIDKKTPICYFKVIVSYLFFSFYSTMYQNRKFIEHMNQGKNIVHTMKRKKSYTTTTLTEEHRHVSRIAKLTHKFSRIKKNLPNGVNHVETHFDAISCVILTRIRKTGYTIITVTENFDS